MDTVPQSNQHECAVCYESIYAPADPGSALFMDHARTTPYKIDPERLFEVFECPNHWSHRFHRECVKKEEKCPVCRTEWTEQIRSQARGTADTSGGRYWYYITPECKHGLLWKIAEPHLRKTQACPSCEVAVTEVPPAEDPFDLSPPGCVSVLTVGLRHLLLGSTPPVKRAKSD